MYTERKNDRTRLCILLLTLSNKTSKLLQLHNIIITVTKIHPIKKEKRQKMNQACYIAWKIVSGIATRVYTPIIIPIYEIQGPPSSVDDFLSLRYHRSPFSLFIGVLGISRARDLYKTTNEGKGDHNVLKKWFLPKFRHLLALFGEKLCNWTFFPKKFTLSSTIEW